MPHLVAAPDKYRGTATATEIATAMARAGDRAGWTVDTIPLADGGEGTLEALDGLGEVRTTVVPGPLGKPVEARWRLLDGPASRRLGSTGPTAVIEAAQAAGRALLPRPRGDDPLRATTAGVGALVLAGVAAGVTDVVVAVGGTATTDGGKGALDAIGGPSALRGARLTVACDVLVPFLEAAPMFAPQKGATPGQVTVLSERLAALAEEYRRRSGRDVRRVPGAGAGGGLAGGLAALGGNLVPGFDLVARVVGLQDRLAHADAVATGEGCLDRTSFAGKVVGGVVRAAGRRPVVCLPGSVAAGPEVAGAVPPLLVVLALDEAVGADRAWADPAGAITTVLAAWLQARP